MFHQATRGLAAGLALLLACSLPTLAKELLVNGDFTQQTAAAKLASWKVNKGSLQAVDGVTTLVLEGSYASATQVVPIDPAWLALDLKAKVRAVDVVPGDQDWKNARIAMTFKDAAGKRVGPWPNVFNAKGTTEWQTFSQTYLVPPGAASLELGPANFGASGRFEIQTISLAPAASSLTPGSPRPVIVLKLDDVTRVTPRWQRVADFLVAEKLHASFGIICSCLEHDDPTLLAWIKKLHDNGDIEFWCHGYKNRTAQDKIGEYEDPSAENQTTSLQTCERLAKEKLGFPLRAFGPHWSGTNKATVEALKQTPDITIVFYYTKGQGGDWFVFDRLFDMEHPIFKPNAAYVSQQFNAIGHAKPYLCFQGHPDQWTDESFEQFKLLVTYLKQQGCSFMTASEYVAAHPPAVR